MVKDALGYDIKIGDCMGYSCRSNGFVSVVVGLVDEINVDKMEVHLVIQSRGRTLYSDPMKPEKDWSKSTVWIIANSLFTLPKGTETAW